jgi:hypothetical protein
MLAKLIVANVILLLEMHVTKWFLSSFWGSPHVLAVLISHTYSH